MPFCPNVCSLHAKGGMSSATLFQCHAASCGVED